MSSSVMGTKGLPCCRAVGKWACWAGRDCRRMKLSTGREHGERTVQDQEGTVPQSIFTPTKVNFFPMPKVLLGLVELTSPFGVAFQALFPLEQRIAMRQAKMITKFM